MSKFGLTLRKKDEPARAEEKPKAAIFNQDSDDEEEDQSASAKFQRKYAGQEKSKDKKTMEKILAENPGIFDYDGQYEKMQRLKDQKVAEQKEADKEKKPKYAHKIMEAHKKRELEKLLHDEHTYKKEREKEADQFEDKEVFITGAYRKQIEEREKFREELEANDKLDELRDVKNQSMWQQAFQRKMLDNMTRVYPEEGETIVKMEEEEGTMGEMKTEKIKGGEEEQEASTKELVRREDVKEEIEEEPKIKRRREEEEEEDERRQRQGHDQRHRERRSRSPRRHGKEHAHEGGGTKHEDGGKRETSGKVPAQPVIDELTEEVRRMEIIRQILRRRNDEKAIEEARKRYFERREMGEIVPPR